MLKSTHRADKNTITHQIIRKSLNNYLRLGSLHVIEDISGSELYVRSSRSRRSPTATLHVHPVQVVIIVIRNHRDTGLAEEPVESLKIKIRNYNRSTIN